MSRPDPEPDRGSDEAEIRAIEADYDDAWGSADLTRLMSVLERDVVILDPRGGTSVGASEARRLLGEFLAGEGASSTHTSRCKRVSFVTDDVALFDGQATIAGRIFRDPSCTTLPTSSCGATAAGGLPTSERMSTWMRERPNKRINPTAQAPYHAEERMTAGYAHKR